MDKGLFNEEPNLIAETYRKLVYNKLPWHFGKHFEFIDINEDGNFLLGTSNLSGRIWSGSIWIFDKFPDAFDIDHCLAGIEFESSVASGKWLNWNRTLAVGCDNGSFQHLTLTRIENQSKGYCTVEGIVTEHDDSIIALEPMPKEGQVLTGGMDMNIKLWDADALVSERSYCPAHGHIVTSLAALPDNKDNFVSTSLDGTTLLWDIRMDKPASLILKNESGFSGCAWIDSNCVAVGSSDGSVSLVDLKMKTELDRYLTSNRAIFKLRYSERSDCLAVCADDPFVKILDCKEKKLTEIYKSDQHTDFVRGLAWDPEGHTLYSCGWDSKVCVHKIPKSDDVESDKKDEPAKEN